MIPTPEKELNSQVLIKNLLLFLNEETRNMLLTFNDIAVRFSKLNHDIDIIKKVCKEKYKISNIDQQLSDIRNLLVANKDILVPIQDYYKNISNLSDNISTIIKEEIDHIVFDYNTSTKAISSHNNKTYKIVIKKKDRLILNDSITDTGFLKSLKKCNAIKNNTKKTEYLIQLVNIIRKDLKSINSKIKKLTERIKLSPDNDSAELKITYAKRSELKQIQKVLNKRLRVIVEIYFNNREKITKDNLRNDKLFFSLFLKEGDMLKECSLNFTIKSDLEEMLKIENLMLRTSKLNEIPEINPFD